MLQKIKNFFRREWILGIALLGSLVAFGLVYFYRWRKGTLLFGLTILFVGIATLVTDEKRKSVIFIRNKYFDGYLFTSIGCLIIYLSFTISSLGT